MSMPIRLEPSDGWRWERLATYNGERLRGIMHDPAYDDFMRQEQDAFEAEQKAEWTAAGGHPIDPDDPESSWIIPGPPPTLWNRIRWWIEGKPLAAADPSRLPDSIDSAMQFAIAFMNDPDGLAPWREEWRDQLRVALHAFRDRKSVFTNKTPSQSAADPKP